MVATTSTGSGGNRDEHFNRCRALHICDHQLSFLKQNMGVFGLGSCLAAGGATWQRDERTCLLPPRRQPLVTKNTPKKATKICTLQLKVWYAR
jgi:hypothetical protein